MVNKGLFSATLLAVSFILSLMLPIIILTYTEKNPPLVALASVLLPIGFYSIFAALSRRSGCMVWCGFPFIFLSAFQVVLSYLFCGSAVAADMFLNLRTTNPTEAHELLSNIYPAIIFVIVVYIPILKVATTHLRNGVVLQSATRRTMLTVGCITLFIGGVVMAVGCRGDAKRVLLDEVFPINVCYNLYFALSENYKINHYKQSSKDYLYHAERSSEYAGKEIYVLVIGEASRAANWQLYGYNRPTNPRLSARDDLAVFRQVTTQSNTTHKSVPMMLSSVHTSQHDELYRRKGLLALFNEAGFATYFISNQQPQGAMIDHLAGEANVVTYLPAPSYDAEMINHLRQRLTGSSSQKILVVLHTYGSHYSYHQRYPREFARFLPDDDRAISMVNAGYIRNSYDNSILYTDYLLSEIISLLEQESACSALFYCADHGEDLFDNEQERFLHSSPTTTYYQLHVASVAWFSSAYKKCFPAKVSAAAYNENAMATTYSVFHTMAEIASLRSPYLDPRASLVSYDCDFAARRYYLDDHNRAVVLDERIGIDKSQEELFRRAGVRVR